MPRNIYVCRYRCDGAELLARIGASDEMDASRKMGELDWAPGCGPVGEPQMERAGGPAEALVQQMLPNKPRPNAGWALPVWGRSLRQYLGASWHPARH